MSTDLGENQVQPALTTLRIGRAYRYLPETDSTNLRLKEAASELPDGAVILTDFQRRGRGRLERRWEAAPGSALLLSVLLRPNWLPEQANWLTMIAGLAVAEAVTEIAGVKTGIKWPNDLMVHHGGIWRKVCGLLLEGEVDANGRFSQAVLGIGINVNMTQAQLPAAITPPTSLLIAAGRPVNRRELLCALLARLEFHYETAVAGRSPQPGWAERLIMLGQPVTVTFTGEDRILRGVATSTDEWGQLQIQDASGELHTVAAGDVTLRS